MLIMTYLQFQAHNIGHLIPDLDVNFDALYTVGNIPPEADNDENDNVHY